MDQNYHTEFLTGTIYNWEHLLNSDDFKHIILDSFQWLVKNKKCTINAFVLMPNHIHLLWKISDGFERKDIQGAMFSFTAHEFKRYLNKKNPALLEKHYVNNSDRTFQFWEREPMVKECWTKTFFRQKLNYIPARRAIQAGILILASRTGIWLRHQSSINGHPQTIMKPGLKTLYG